MKLASLFAWVGRWRQLARIALCVVFPLAVLADPLMEEGFDYAPGGDLGTNTPWHGSGTAISVSAGSLDFTSLRVVAPAGNSILVTGGSEELVYRNFTDTPVTDGYVYFATLVRCISPPGTTDLYIASLQASGSTGPSGRVDPLCLYFQGTNGGYRIGIRHTENDADFAPAVLAVGTTHFIVMKYLFGAGGDAQLYIDPAPGGLEPAVPDADSQLARDADDLPTSDPPDLQVVGFRALTNLDQGQWQFDTMRIGTNWADVAPTGLALTGPADQVGCLGGSISFSVVADGTPPIVYQWRTNGVPIPDATNSSLVLNSATLSDQLLAYDVAVADAFESVSSRVASLALSTVAPGISQEPITQILPAGVSNATLAVVVTGDAPLLYQWRTNGVAIPGATDPSWTVSNPVPADTTNLFYDVVIANPCGSVTSAPPVQVLYPNPFFLADGLPGFFSGMNLFTTNTGGAMLFAWSSPDLNAPIPTWTLEGPLAEQPLNDGTGKSRYTINVNPLVSPEYYLIGVSTAWPYLQPVPVEWITTDTSGNYSLFTGQLAIDANGVLFVPPHPFFAADALPAFFSGLNLFCTNSPAMALYAWSSPDPSQSVTNWTLEGILSEQPLNNAAGDSRYTINVTPVASPMFYVIGETNSGPYVNPAPVQSVTTDSQGNYTLTVELMGIDANGFLGWAPAIITQPTSASLLAGKGASFSVTATGAAPLSYQWYFAAQPLPGATASTLSLASVTTANSGNYWVVVTNGAGAVTSSVAALTILAPASVSGSARTNGFQLLSTGIPAQAYWVQCASNLASPVVWTTVATNLVGSNGQVQFLDPQTQGNPRRFYRLVFP